ncbi:hypothetical protein DIPPA_59862 [Diplonema papillatum]|nr:hypothetical protein DIPPA_59862 [Diplonema papillatum]
MSKSYDIFIEPSNGQIGLNYSANPDDGFVWIGEPKPGSLAEKAGIQPGILLAVNGQPVRSEKEMVDLVGAARRNQPCNLRLEIGPGADLPMETTQSQNQLGLRPSGYVNQLGVSEDPYSQQTVNLLTPVMPFFEPSHDPAAKQLLEEAIAALEAAGRADVLDSFTFPAPDEAFWENLCAQIALSPQANEEPHYVINATHDNTEMQVNKLWLNAFIRAWRKVNPHRVSVWNDTSKVTFETSDAFWQAVINQLAHMESEELQVASSLDPGRPPLRPSLEMWNNAVENWLRENGTNDESRRQHLERRWAEVNRHRESERMGQSLKSRTSKADPLAYVSLPARRMSSEAALGASRRMTTQPEPMNIASFGVAPPPPMMSVPQPVAIPSYGQVVPTAHASCTRCKSLQNKVRELERNIRRGESMSPRYNDWEQRLMRREQALLAAEVNQSPRGTIDRYHRSDVGPPSRFFDSPVRGLRDGRQPYAPLPPASARAYKEYMQLLDDIDSGKYTGTQLTHYDSTRSRRGTSTPSPPRLMAPLSSSRGPIPLAARQSSRMSTRATERQANAFDFVECYDDI